MGFNDSSWMAMAQIRFNMLISVTELLRVYGVKANGVLHVGAHEAEEAEDYHSHSWGPVIWVEMLPDKYELLQNRFFGDSQNTVFDAACWDEDDVELPMYRANNGQSSSLLPPELHLTYHPDIIFSEKANVRTRRLDSILPKTAKFDFINFDVQGAELRAIDGLGPLLEQVKWAYIEVNELSLYEGCPLIEEIDNFMKKRGFVRIAKRIAGNFGWGDALYVRASQISWRTLLWLRLKSAIYDMGIFIYAYGLKLKNREHDIGKV